jgi:hypothetical protein
MIARPIEEAEMKKSAIVLVCVVLCCAASDVYAGGSEPELFDPIGALVPLDAKTPVQLKRVEIIVSTTPWHGYKRVAVQTVDNMFDPNSPDNFDYNYTSSAIYTLYNPTDKSITLEAAVPAGHDVRSYSNINEEPVPMQILVDGKLVTPKMIKPPKGARWMSKSVQLLDSPSITLTLPAKGNVVVMVEHGFDHFGNTHNIRSPHSFDFLGATITFATRGAARWSGAIDEIKVELRLRDMVPFMYGIPKDFEPESRSVHIVREGASEYLESRLVISAKNTDYKQDIIIDMDHRLDPDGSPCLYPGFYLYSALDANLNSVPIQDLKSNLLEYSSQEELGYCRNMIYARYGYNFKDERYRRAFYRPPRVSKDRKIVYPAPNKSFDVRMINLIEQELIKFIKVREAAAGVKNEGVLAE